LGEAPHKTKYIQKISPHKVLEGMNHEEAFSKRNSEVGNMRIYGCPVYIHFPKDKRNMIEPLGKKGIF